MIPLSCTAGSGLVVGGMCWGSPGCYGEGREGPTLQALGTLRAQRCRAVMEPFGLPPLGCRRVFP